LLRWPKPLLVFIEESLQMFYRLAKGTNVRNESSKTGYTILGFPDGTP
jgi:hypothetical protein